MEKLYSFIALIIIYVFIIFLIKRCKKKVIKVIFIVLAIISFPVIYLTIWFNFPYYYLAPFKGRAIDTDTKQPIEGAAVLAVYYRCLPSVQGSISFPIDAQETLTDNNGEFRIPEVSIWFGGNPRSPQNQDLTIFKPGYGVFPNHNRSRAIGINKSWPPSDKYIVCELPKLKTREERDNNIHFTTPEITNVKMKNFIRSLNEERISLGYDPFTITEEER
jgi:energy-coupling factor transporter transmembrane protein EcfT